MCGGSHVCVRFRTPLRLLNLISSAFTPTTNQKKTMKSPLCRRHERQFAPTGHSWKLFCFYRKMYVYDNTCFADASAIGVSRSLSRFFANLRTIKTPASSANFNHCSPNYAFVCSCSRDGPCFTCVRYVWYKMNLHLLNTWFKFCILLYQSLEN